MFLFAARAARAQADLYERVLRAMSGSAMVSESVICSRFTLVEVEEPHSLAIVLIRMIECCA